MLYCGSYLSSAKELISFVQVNKIIPIYRSIAMIASVIGAGGLIEWGTK